MSAPSGLLEATARPVEPVEATFDEIFATTPKVGFQVLLGANTVVKISQFGGTAMSAPIGPRVARFRETMAKLRIVRDATPRPKVTATASDILLDYYSYETSIAEAEAAGR